MSINNENFLADFTKFVELSLNWCIKESEKEAAYISDAVNLLVQDIERRSSMTSTTIEALNQVKGKIESFFKQSKMNVPKLMLELKKLSSNQKEMHELIHPIIEGLQFQDRLRQNLENYTKIVRLWIKERNISTDEKSSDAILHKFGEKLLTCTTSTDERDLIRQLIPSLPEEKKVDDVMMF